MKSHDNHMVNYRRKPHRTRDTRLMRKFKVRQNFGLPEQASAGCQSHARGPRIPYGYPLYVAGTYLAYGVICSSLVGS